MRRSLLALSAILAIALAGCATAEPEASEAPSASPSPTASETPSASPSPTEEPVAEAPQCGDAYLLATNAMAPTGFVGTDDEVLASMAPAAGFVDPAALDGLDVRCTVTYLGIADGPGGSSIVEVSVAFVGADPAPVPALEAWATAAGYVADGAGAPAEWSQPPAADGTTTQKVVWLTSADRGLDDAAVADLATQTGVPMDASTMQVVHSDFTVGG
ncbi:hypothetical protein [Agrococcus jejuensis]|uniref:DUF3558 domain-containing protein n=1 Tax=Agrococcus jejuensis TaxID=399736 RepID=A0A1G8B7X5_9MICO|nr:hypothetical protein [Agrococcus jejuensis]SDH29241.1 hypothetical protein SAMN04489720_0721 [Agrococcus jejuensis]